MPLTLFATLARAVADGAQPAELLPELHREVLGATRGTASVILQRTPRTGAYHATSGRGFADLGGAWLDDEEGRALTRLVEGGAAVCDLERFPTLRARLGAPAALVVAVTERPDPALLLVAAPSLTDADALETGARAGVEFALALQLSRLARLAALHQKLQELFLAFSRGISATLGGLGPALDTLAHETNALFGTRRTSIWLHNRRARELSLAASSDPAYAAPALATESQAPPARGLRLDRPTVVVDAGEPLLLAPLRGWRRALGTIVIEGSAPELDDREFAEAAYELARQLSVAVENVHLLEEVLQQRRLLEDTFNSLADLVVVVDTAGRVVQTNDTFAARVDAARQALVQRPLAELIGGPMMAWLSEGRPPDAPASARTSQFTDDRLGGIFAATVTPLINQDGDPVGQVLVIRDITAQTALEREQTALRERLAQSEKLASLGQFVAGIAHEMNNPLQGVLGHLELLMTTSEAAKPLRPTLRKIYQEGDRAAKIVRNLLVFAGSRRMVRRPIRIERVISRALASRSAAHRRGRITVTRTTADDVPAVSGDTLLLQQAFLNIIINAEHALAAVEGERRIEIDVTASRGMVRTTIRDTGHGIAATTLPRIFDPFFTTKDVGKGTGLGLAITYGIVQEHGGTIHASNAADGGAVFVIELPAQV